MNFRIAVATTVILAMLASSGYMYYQTSQHRIKVLTEVNSKLALKIDVQAKTITEIQLQYKQQTAALTSLNKSNASLYLEKEQLSNKLMKHDLEELSKRKPALIETRINNGTKELFRSLVDISTE
jgi:uncharacterized protein YhbP (UPF0306 family)